MFLAPDLTNHLLLVTRPIGSHSAETPSARAAAMKVFFSSLARREALELSPEATATEAKQQLAEVLQCEATALSLVLGTSTWDDGKAKERGLRVLEATAPLPCNASFSLQALTDCSKHPEKMLLHALHHTTPRSFLGKISTLPGRAVRGG